MRINDDKQAHSVTQGNVVSVAYTINNPDGDELDSTAETGPLHYIQGSKMLLLRIQNALEGKRIGDVVDIVLRAEEGYGKRRDDLVQPMERALFNAKDIRPGMQFGIDTEDGARLATVDSIDGNDVIVDLNHPLAGQELHIRAKVVAIRKATDEELRREEIRQV